MICASTSTSSAVVGSSATTKLGPQHQRERDHQPLPHAPGELVRVGAVARRRDAHPAQHVERALLDLLPCRGPARGSAASPRKCSRIRISGLSRVSGSWKIMREIDTAQRDELLGRKVEQVRPLEAELARPSSLPRAAAPAGRGRAWTCRSRTPRPGPGSRPCAPSNDDPVDGADRAPVGAVPDPYVAPVDDGLVVRPGAEASPSRSSIIGRRLPVRQRSACPASCGGSTTSRSRRLRRVGLTVSFRPSPTRVSPVTTEHDRQTREHCGPPDARRRRRRARGSRS